MNLPNKLTLTRIILVPVFMVFVSLTQIGTEDFNPTWYLVAGIIFAAASFTDFLDGHLARKWNMVTDFGKFADPLADKMLVTAAMLWFVEIGQMPAWMLLIVICREFAVSGLRMVAASNGSVLAAGWSGKLKTTLQVAALISYFLFIRTEYLWIAQALISLAVVMTLISGALYICGYMKARKRIS